MAIPAGLLDGADGRVRVWGYERDGTEIPFGELSRGQFLLDSSTPGIAIANLSSRFEDALADRTPPEIAVWTGEPNERVGEHVTTIRLDGDRVAGIDSFTVDGTSVDQYGQTTVLFREPVPSNGSCLPYLDAYGNLVGMGCPSMRTESGGQGVLCGCRLGGVVRTGVIYDQWLLEGWGNWPGLMELLKHLERNGFDCIVSSRIIALQGGRWFGPYTPTAVAPGRLVVATVSESPLDQLGLLVEHSDPHWRGVDDGPERDAAVEIRPGDMADSVLAVGAVGAPSNARILILEAGRSTELGSGTCNPISTYLEWRRTAPATEPNPGPTPLPSRGSGAAPPPTAIGVP